MKSLGPDQVSLHGEPRGAARVRVAPYWELENEPDNHYSLFVNQDSMPEIEAATVVSYLQLIRRKGRGLFLSLNQESGGLNTRNTAQSIVYELVARVGGFRRLARYPYWMRAGYVEELYEFG